ncbi:MAG: 1-acyl-sn-glycerol-3-phosphate acyltransferase [Proteobacteria bacterium]|nr:1-acyl-sn-glycerol-3-phosphate acyltransferase [Pseudomonadota bacterium]MBU1744442.1 1-acyl-sn-glycerol-3-phosphate acyltransferase [Pseudomonadota bacterium]MBU1965346.1 1-acyl-sn-glycerol-3-phosphate acyltransferase [Pseudomonadota bacterium]MBU4581653.1 1-acyl-sn-glycerol-3-phosphate acyltransferase [Pseudomonadota bacterium]MCG2740085.1 1-acyl-sn-glycerol-3-phosphate acyltransferase [Syntrophaceae bacterium]
MSILSAIRGHLAARCPHWTTEIDIYHAGSLYREENFPLYWLVRKVLSKVQFSDETAEGLKSLAEKGVVVYALKNKSQLNSLILRELSMRKGIPPPVYCHGINMITWQPYPMAIRVILSHLFRRILRKTAIHSNRMDHLSRLTLEGKSSIIHLGESELFENLFVEETLHRLLEAQESSAVPIYLCPELITYGRRREKEKESLLNIFFGQSDSTDPVRRVITFLRYSNMASVISAEPVNLAEYIKAGGDRPREELVRELREELIERIDEEKTAIVGPILKSREEIIGMVLRDKVLVSFMEEMAAKAKKGKRDVAAVRKEARKYLEEIASDYSDIFIEIWEKILTWLWNNIYDGVVVDGEGIAKIRQISKKMPFVIIPCHRSHFDYLLLSYSFYKNNIQMPFVAAGTNLAFFPMGYIFRKSGAFFLRRSFKRNDLYAEVFARYVKVLLQEGLPLEFFIEGGRSRTGKMVMPKYGLLSMIIQAYQEKACDDLAAIPVYIGYDRVIEEKAYLEELGGVPKEKEKTTDIIRSGKLLRKRYGRVYMNVGEPILLKSYLAAQEKPLEEMTVAERQGLYRRIGYTIVRAINKVSVVTPFALTASGLLCYDRRGISLGELREVLALFFDYLSSRRVSFAMTFADRDKAVTEALNLFDQSGLISRMGAEEEEEEIEEVVYSLEDDKRMNLEYYKNTILHYFLPVSFVATSVLATPEDMLPLNRIRDDYAFFKRLFRHEFIFDDQKDDLEEVRETLSYLRDQGMIAGFDREGQPWIEVKGRGRTNLLPFGGLIHNYMESYWVVVRGCYYLRKGPKAEKDWLKYIRGLGARMYRKGEIRRAEALSQSNYQSAIRYLEDVNIISVTEVSEKGDKKFTKRYALTENKVQMESLRRRLFKFL